MNDKQLAQVEEWLKGQKRYKLLDTERKDVLKLKGSLLQVWLAQYMNENDDQESWLSIATLMEQTGLSEHTVIDARKKLTRDGWSRRHANKTAAQKYEKPTRGAHKVPVYSVDDPSAKSAGAVFASAISAPANVIPPKIADKVYGSGCSSGYSSSYNLLADTVTSKQASLLALPSGEEKPENPKPTTKPIVPVPSTNPVPPPPVPPVPATRKKVKTAGDGTPWPDDFDTWTNPARCEWLDAHAVPVPLAPSNPTPTKGSPAEPKAEPPLKSLLIAQSRKAAAPPADNEPDEWARPQPQPELDELSESEPPPGASAPLSAFAGPLRQPTPLPSNSFKCPVCEYGDNCSFYLAVHIEKEHPELGTQLFKIACPHDGCKWITGWDKVTNDKAQKEAALREHLDEKHAG